MDANTAVRSLGGIARRSDIVALVGRREFDKAVHERSVRPNGRGTYSTGATSYERIVASQLRGVVSHLAAAWHWNIGTARFPAEFDVTVPRHSARTRVPTNVCLHYADLDPADVTDGYTTQLRTVVDCVRDTTAPTALAVVEDAIRTEAVTPDQVRERVNALRGPRSARARRILSWLDSRAQSPLESALRGILLEVGITCFQPQLEIFDGDSKLATVDLGDPRSGVLLEADSYLWHGGRARFAQDAKRYDELVSRGYRVLRFAFDHVASEPGLVLDIVRRTLRYPPRI